MFTFTKVALLVYLPFIPGIFYVLGVGMAHSSFNTAMMTKMPLFTQNSSIKYSFYEALKFNMRSTCFEARELFLQIL